MASHRHRALVVEDEVPIQKLMANALVGQGIECQLAADGCQASELLAEGTFDAVITDLKMPNKHGHALTLELLELDPKPLIFVHTGVIEPRLAKDLLVRGVDDILFKPTDFGLLALKVRTMIEKRRQFLSASPALAVKQDSDSGEENGKDPVSLLKLNDKMSEISSVLPISTTALDVYDMTRTCEWDLSQIAAAIQRDASLSAEVLRLANCSLYNRTSQKILALDEAVLRIGQKRVGELALTSMAISALTPRLLPWMDIDLAWKRSMASGIILEGLVEAGGHQRIEDGLLLSTIMHPLGRVLLGMLFPKHYELMAKQSQLTGESLEEQERRVFPTNHAEIMAQLLSSWDIPHEVFLPLKFSCDDFTTLARLSEPSRTKAELVKTAILLGALAVDRWETADLVQVPPLNLLKRLQIKNVHGLLEGARSDLAKLADFHPTKSVKGPPAKKPPVKRPVTYCNASENEIDLVRELLPSLGWQPRNCLPTELADLDEPVIVNCLGVAPTHFASFRSKKNAIVLTDPEKHEVYARTTQAVSIPTSYRQIEQSLRNHIEASGDLTSIEPLSCYA